MSNKTNYAVQINNQEEFDELMEIAEEEIKSIKNHLRVATNSPFTLEELLSDYYKTLETLKGKE